MLAEKQVASVVFRGCVSLGLLCCAYLVTTQAVAEWYFQEGTLEGLRKAIQWNSRNSEYYVTLARVLTNSVEGADVHEVIHLYEKATRLSPHRAPYWAELGGAC